MILKLPSRAIDRTLEDKLFNAGLPLIHQGKVRDTYALEDPKYLLVVATDRLSVFDFVLPTLLKGKGEILTALTVFWLTGPLKSVKNHLVAYGSGMDPYLPRLLHGFLELKRRAIIVQSLTMQPVECVVRGYLTGSGYVSYKETGSVCGALLPEGLHDGSKLPKAIFTPTTKAQIGHDLPIDAASVSSILSSESICAYETAAEYAAKSGVIIADTKFEWGVSGNTSDIILADEVLTPDSSRFWALDLWRQSQKLRKPPPSYDKEVVRDWGKTIITPWGLGMGGLDPEKLEHLAYIHSELEVPETVLAETLARYRIIFRMLAGCPLQIFQREYLGITDLSR